jgi:hypothetical protein
VIRLSNGVNWSSKGRQDPQENRSNQQSLVEWVTTVNGSLHSGRRRPRWCCRRKVRASFRTRGRSQRAAGGKGNKAGERIFGPSAHDVCERDARHGRGIPKNRILPERNTPASPLISWSGSLILSVTSPASDRSGSRTGIPEKENYPVKKPNVHIVPRDGQWAVIREGAQRDSSHHSTQAEAINAGRGTAQRDRV